jgi:hypothetical protein
VEPGVLGQLSTCRGVLCFGAAGVVSVGRARIAVEGPGWGGGVVGDRFAGGPGGWVRRLVMVAAPVGVKVGLVDCYARRLGYACTHFRAIRAGLAPWMRYRRVAAGDAFV